MAKADKQTSSWSLRLWSSMEIRVEGFLKIDNLCFELSHSKELSLKSLSTM